METIRETAKSLIRQSLLDPILKGESNVETLKSQPIQKLLNSLESIVLITRFRDILGFSKRKEEI